MKRLFSLFLKKKNPQELSKSNSFEGWKAFEKGNELYYNQRKNEEALIFYDTAIENDVKEAYVSRAFCLQSLKYHFEAIADFNKAISLNSNNANYFFGRGNSKVALGDFEGQIADLKIAIDLSSKDSEINRINDVGAKQQGFESSRTLYNSTLNAALTKLEIMNNNHLFKTKYLEKLDNRRRIL